MHLLLCVVILAAIAVFAPSSGISWAPPIARWLDGLAKHRSACILGIAVLSLLFSFGSNLVLKTPAPRCADEFGYLLQGDTYSRGRLKNATPAMWKHFQTFDVIFEPAYTAKYPPAQGAALALGHLLGKPIIGVWLSTAFTCAAILWMLFAWLPPRWALPVSLLATFDPELAMWNWDYWGGSIALGGGALVLGSYRRIADPASTESPVLAGGAMGLGMAILANSRPFEGLALSLAVIAVLLFDLARTRRLPILLRALPPWIAILAITGAFILYYNKDITGNAFQFPFMLYERTYDCAPLFIWQKLPPVPIYRNPDLLRWYQGARDFYASQQTFGGFCHVSLAKVADLGLFFWSGLALVLLAATPVAIRHDPWLWRALVFVLVSAAAIAGSNYLMVHYEAPVLSLLFVFLGACAQRIWQWKLRGRPSGAFFVTGMALLLLGYSLSFFFIRQHKNQNGANWGFWRNQIVSDLARDGHKHLILVHYSSNHNDNEEWVYNGADLDSPPVLWAEDMGADQNRELLDYYKDRVVWVFDPDADAKPRPYRADTANPAGKPALSPI